IQEPIIKSVDPSDTPVVTLSLEADLPESELFDLADRDVKPLLEQIDQVGEVQIVGVRKREIQVSLDLHKLRGREMTASEVVGRLGAAGQNIPAGELTDPNRETLVRTVGQFESLQAISRTPIRLVGNEAVTTLDRVAKVTDGLEDEKNRVTINGK